MTRSASIAFKILGCLLLAGALAYGALASMDADTLKTRVSSVIEQTLGVRIAFNGPVSLRFFPWLGVEMRDVDLSFTANGESIQLAHMERIDSAFKLLPLAAGRVEAGKVILSGLNLHLVRDSSGDLLLPLLKVKDVRVEGKNVVVTTQDDTTIRLGYEIAGVEVLGASVAFEDRRNGSRSEVSGLNLRAGAVRQGQPFDIRLAFDYALGTPEVAGSLELGGSATVVPELLRFAFDNASLKIAARGAALPASPLDAAFNGSFKLDVNAGQARGDGLSLTLKGLGNAPLTVSLEALLDQKSGVLEASNLAASVGGANFSGGARVTGLDGSPALEGSLQAGRFSPREALASFGRALPKTADPAAFSAIQGKMSFSGKGGLYALRTEGLELDGAKLELAAELQARAGSGRPQARLKLKADALNLDRYAPAAATQQKEKAPSAAPALPLDIQAEIDVAALTAAKIHMREVFANASLRDNVLEADPVRLTLHQGTVKASLKADLRPPAAQPVSLSATVDGVQLEPLLREATGAARIAGRLNAVAALSGKGLSVDKLLPTLNGKVTFTVRSGALLGVDVTPGALKSPEALKKNLAPQERTPFERVSASAAIQSGTAHVGDLLVSMPPHKVTGQGWFNIPSQTLDMRLLASFAKLPNIPVHVTGKASDPSIALDAGAVAKGVLDSVGGVFGLTK